MSYIFLISGLLVVFLAIYKFREYNIQKKKANEKNIKLKTKYVLKQSVFYLLVGIVSISVAFSIK